MEITSFSFGPNLTFKSSPGGSEHGSTPPLAPKAPELPEGVAYRANGYYAKASAGLHVICPRTWTVEKLRAIADHMEHMERQAAATQPAAPVVTDEMVDAAMAAYWPTDAAGRVVTDGTMRDHMRMAIIKALHSQRSAQKDAL